MEISVVGEATNVWAFGWAEIFAILNLLLLGSATLFAIRTVSRIRKERHTTRQAEVAEEVLALTYEGQRVFGSIRNMMTAGDDVLKFYMNRIDQHDKYFDQLIAVIPRCKAFLGKELVDEVEYLLKLRNKLAIDAWVVWGDGNQSHRAENREAFESVFAGREDDKIQLKLNQIEKTVEDKLLPIIRGKGSI